MPFPAFFLLAAALGAREGITRRRDKNSAIDAEAERIETINNIDLGIDRQGLSNQFDADQIEVMQRQFQTAQGLLRSPDPKMQGIGANMLQDLDTAVRGNIQQNENEFRAEKIRQEDQEIAVTGLGRADNEKRFERELKMNDQLNTALQPSREAQVGYDKIINALENNDFTGSQIALTAMIQAIDGSVVRGEELANYQSTNGAINFLVNALNKVEGKDFTEDTKTSIRNGAAALINAEKARAIALTETFQKRAVAFSLDPVKVLAGIDRNLYRPIPINREAMEADQAASDEAERAFAEAPGEFVEETGELVGINIPGTSKRLSVNPSRNITERLVRPFLELTGSIGRVLRGAKLLRKSDGTLWIQETDGSLSPVTNQDYIDAQAAVGEPVQLAPGLQQRIAERDVRLAERDNPQ